MRAWTPVSGVGRVFARLDGRGGRPYVGVVGRGKARLYTGRVTINDSV